MPLRLWAIFIANAREEPGSHTAVLPSAIELLAVGLFPALLGVYISARPLNLVGASDICLTYDLSDARPDRF